MDIYFKEFLLVSEIRDILDKDASQYALRAGSKIGFDDYEVRQNCRYDFGKTMDDYLPPNWVHDWYDTPEAKQIADQEARWHNYNYARGTEPYAYVQRKLQELQLLRRQKQQEFNAKNNAEYLVHKQRYQDDLNRHITDCVERKRQEFEQGAPDRPKHSSYSFNFNYEGNSYSVSMTLTSAHVPGIGEVPGVWSIGFRGPQGYSSTGLGRGMMVIYTNMLMAIKRLMETEVVNGFSFYGAESAMDLVYDKFVKQLIGKDFVRVSPEVLVRKTWIERKLVSADSETQQRVLQNIQRAEADHERSMEYKRREKNRMKGRGND